MNIQTPGVLYSCSVLEMMCEHHSVISYSAQSYHMCGSLLVGCYREDGLVRNAGPSGGRLQAEPKKGIGRDLPKNTLGTGPPVLKEGLIGGHQWEVWTVILWSMAP